MKKLVLTLALAAMSAATVQAQLTSPAKLGARAGLNFSNMRESASGFSYTPDVRTSFHAGVSLEQTIGVQGFLLETGLYFSSKGCIFPMSELSPYDVDVKLVLNYIQVPLMVGYRYDVDRRVALKGFFGCYVAYGLSGKMKAEGYSFDVMGHGMRYTDDFDMGFDAKLKRFDAGLRFGAGVELDERYTLSLGYELGLADINGTKAAGDFSSVKAKDKNRCATLTLGYNF